MALERNLKKILDRESQKQRSIFENKQTKDCVKNNQRKEKKWIRHIKMRRNNEWITIIEGKIERKVERGNQEFFS